jgi:hypothetical protein
MEDMNKEDRGREWNIAVNRDWAGISGAYRN